MPRRERPFNYSGELSINGEEFNYFNSDSSHNYIKNVAKKLRESGYKARIIFNRTEDMYIVYKGPKSIRRKK